MRKIAGDSVDVHSAGTQPGASLNALSAESLAEVGIDIDDAVRWLSGQVPLPQECDMPGAHLEQATSHLPNAGVKLVS